MKRFVFLVCLLALLLSACSVPEQPPTILEGNDTCGIYQLTFETKQISNDCVGNDWSFTYTYNGNTIQTGHKLTCSVEVFSFQTVTVEARENDKLDDVGTGDMTVAICDGGSGKTTITVTENGGRHKGCEAVWEITCTVKLLGKQSNGGISQDL